MRGGQRVGEGDRDLEELRQRHAAAGYQLVERAPLDQLHRQEPDAVGLLDRVDRDDVRVVERGNGARFALEAGEPSGSRANGGGQHFDRDVAAQPRVARAVDLAHAAGAERSQDLYGPRRVPADRGMGRRSF